MSEIRWEVYSDLIPLSGRPRSIGDVMAPDKATALERAKELHGARIVVQSCASRKCADRELTVPLKPVRSREDIATLARLNAERSRLRKARAAKSAAKTAVQPVTPCNTPDDA